MRWIVKKSPMIMRDKGEEMSKLDELQKYVEKKNAEKEKEDKVRNNKEDILREKIKELLPRIDELLKIRDYCEANDIKIKVRDEEFCTQNIYFADKIDLFTDGYVVSPRQLYSKYKNVLCVNNSLYLGIADEEKIGKNELWMHSNHSLNDLESCNSKFLRALETFLNVYDYFEDKYYVMIDNILSADKEQPIEKEER